MNEIKGFLSECTRSRAFLGALVLSIAFLLIGVACIASGNGDDGCFCVFMATATTGLPMLWRLARGGLGRAKRRVGPHFDGPQGGPSCDGRE